MQETKSATHNDDLTTGVAKLLSESTHKHSDVEVQVDGKTFYCHKLILAIKSPYFEEKFYSAETEADDKPIVLDDIGAETFGKVIQFIYTGATELSDENVNDILKVADLLQLQELKKFCVDYLLERGPANTCPGSWQVAKQMNIDTLASDCKNTCLKEFGSMRSSSELKQLSENMVRELLADDELVVDSEVDVCETFMTWLNSQKESGKSVNAHELLTLIRWSGVPVEYIRNRLLTNSTLVADPECSEFLTKVISYRLSGVQFSGLNTFHRPSTGVEQCFVAVIGFKSESAVTSEVHHVSLQRKELIKSAPEIPFRMTTESAGCVSGNELYITGVEKSNAETWKWESVFGWTRCTDMVEGRRRHCATFVSSTSMYILGGYDDTSPMDSIEQYNTITNKWTNVGQLIHASYSSACAVYKTSIYVFAGRQQKKVNIDTVQVFDTATKVCCELTQRLPHPEHLLKSVMWNESVILINNRTCLIFDLQQQTFQRRDLFAAGVVHFGLALEDGYIYIVGGGNGRDDDGRTTWTCADEVKRVAVIDIINNETPPNWIHHAKLPTPACVDAYATMTLPI